MIDYVGILNAVLAEQVARLALTMACQLEDDPAPEPGAAP